MEDWQALIGLAENVTTLSILVACIKFLIDDNRHDKDFLEKLRLEEREERRQRQQDIFEDWKRLRDLSQ